MKKVVKLTEEELMQVINESVQSVLNEIDGATHARVINATEKAIALNQQGIYDTPIANNSDRVINHDNVLDKAANTKKRADQSLIKSYGDATFQFYATDRNGVRGRFNFKPRDIRKLMNNEAILNGDIFYDNKPFNGNILINIANNRVYYIAQKTRYRYPLEIDNRTKSEWDIFVAQLKSSLDHRLSAEEIKAYVEAIKQKRSLNK